MAAPQWILFTLVLAMAVVIVVAPPPKNYVSIKSELPAALTVHCLGQGADLGSQTVAAGKEYGFSFYLDNTGNAVYTCRFDWNGRSSSFDVFSAHGGDVGACSNCVWSVHVNGFLRNGQGPLYFWH